VSPDVATSIALLDASDAAAMCPFLQSLKKRKRFLRRQAKVVPQVENKFPSPL